MNTDVALSVGTKSNGIASSEHLLEGKYSIKDLVNINRLRMLFEEFTKTTGFTTGFVSYPDQEILIATGWRDACTQYHRPCPASAEACRKSNIYLTSCLKKLKELNIKRCANGLVDGATPVIIRGKHLASVSTGQVLLEPPDPAFFKRQAKKYGYDEKSYLAAIRELPVVTRQQMKQALRYLSGLAVFVAEEGLNALRVTESAELLKEENARRQMSELALQKSEERYRTLIEQAPDGLFVVEPQGDRYRVVDVSFAACRMFGYSREEALGLSISDVILPEELPRVAAEVAKLESRETEFTEWRLRRKDGSVFPAELRTRLIPDGKLQGFVRDLTHQKRVEAELRESEKKYRDLFETARDAILTAEPATARFTSGNPAALKMFGAKTEEEFISHGPMDLSPERQPDRRVSAEKAREMIEKTLRTGTSFFEWKHRRINGEEFFADVLLTRMERDGKTAILANVRDITERKELEHEVLEICTREQLRIGQDLHDDLCQWLSGTYLLSASLAKDLAKESHPSAARATEISEYLQQTVLRARKLARGLTPASIEAEGLAGALRELAANTGEMFRIRCSCDCGAAVEARDKITALHLYRIAQEAITNAVRHGRAREVCIVLQAHEDRASMLIRDDGCGIPQPLPETSGIGLRTMRYRAGIIGATLEIRPGAGGGTEIVCAFPT